jgi:hypothetical protein
VTGYAPDWFSVNGFDLDSNPHETHQTELVSAVQQ